MEEKITTLIGLANTDKDFKGTRHNIGAKFLEWFVEDFGGVWHEKGNILSSDIDVEGYIVKVIVGKYGMNKSGKVFKNRNIEKDEILLFYDDVSISLGKVKLSVGRSSGGHNGVKSIIESLGSKDFARFRIGIGPHRGIMSKFVLDKWNKEEMNTLRMTYLQYKIIMIDIIKKGVVYSMNKHNNLL